MEPTIFPHNATIDFSKTLNVKFGIDPTSDKLHLGHLIPLLEVKKMLDHGHKVDIVLGTFTAQMGDPSGKDTMRPVLSKDEVIKNADSIAEQVRRILKGNSEWEGWVFQENNNWFEKMSAVQMLSILSKFTTTQLLSRDSFQKRMEDKNPIGMHELVVPILQGYDSVVLNTDVEIGGTDQLFNFGITRDMQRLHGQEPEVCILMPIINGTDGRKMSKSFDNCIFINDIPEDVFGKTMSISDDLMHEWLPVFFEQSIASSMNPMVLKKKLAFEITKLIWSESDATKAKDHFESVIQNRNNPTDFNECKSGELLIDIVKEIRKCSKSEAMRLIKAGAVSIDGIVIAGVEVSKENMSSGMIPELGSIIKIGKRDFVKIV